MGNRVRVVIGAVLAVLVVVNLLMILWVGPEVIVTDEGIKEQPPKDWEDQGDPSEEPDIYTIIPSDPPDDEK
jgi:hypothetical protein